MFNLHNLAIKTNYLAVNLNGLLDVSNAIDRMAFLLTRLSISQ